MCVEFVYVFVFPLPFVFFLLFGFGLLVVLIIVACCNYVCVYIYSVYFCGLYCDRPVCAMCVSFIVSCCVLTCVSGNLICVFLAL